MVRGQLEHLSVTWDQVTAFRLVRHHLYKRASTEDLIPVVGDMVGAQAQLLSAAQISLWSRVHNLQIAHIEAAFKERVLVKAACMRRTLFLVPAGQLAVFVRGTARRSEKEIRWALGKGVTGRVVEAAIQAALEAMDEPLTRPEIAERACRTLGVQIQTYHGGGWGRNAKLAAIPVGDLNYPVVELLHLAAARGVFCYGPSRGNEPTFIRADAWIPGWKDISREEAEERLLTLYLQAFGPATASDFSLWSGMTLTEARDIWRRIQAGLESVNVEGWAAEILREDLGTLAQARFEPPLVRLLPFFDTYLLGHKERDHLVALEHRSSVFRPQGWIAPVILVNGRVSGVWEHARRGNRLHVKVIKLEPAGTIIDKRIQEEAQDLGRFLGIQDVEFDHGNGLV